MLDLISVARPAGQVLSRTVQFSIAGTAYTLPVRSIAANREWRAQADGVDVGVLNGLEAAGDDITTLLGVLGNRVDTLLDLLLSYDYTGVLPSRDAIEAIEPDCSLDLATAVGEVWKAANPLVVGAVALATTDEPPTNGSSPPTSLPPRNTAGNRKRSRKT